MNNSTGLGLKQKPWGAGQAVAVACSGLAASSVIFGLIGSAAWAVSKSLFPETQVLLTNLGLPAALALGSLGSLVLLGAVAPEAAKKGWRDAGTSHELKFANELMPLLKNASVQVGLGASAVGLVAASSLSDGALSSGLFVCGFIATAATPCWGLFAPLVRSDLALSSSAAAAPVKAKPKGPR